MGGLLRRLNGFLVLAGKEFSSNALPKSVRIEALLSGTRSNALWVMEPEVRRTRSFIPGSLLYRRLPVYNSSAIAFFGNKLSQKLWLDQRFPDYAPPVHYYITADQLIPVAAEAPPRSCADLPTLIRDYGGLFLKPSDGGHGRGATHLALRGSVIECNGEPISDETLIRTAAQTWQGYVVSEIIPNTPWTAKFYDRTLNTLRVLTGVRPDTKQPVILSAIFKMGRDASYPVDNWKSGFGGITAKVDLETGQLGTGVAAVIGVGGGRRLLGAHPESGQTITGEIVPTWPAVKRSVLEIVRQIPVQGMVGWDVALTPTGITVVEANGMLGIDIHEAHESLLATEAQRSCFARMKIFPRGQKRKRI